MQALRADPSLVEFWCNRATSEQRDIIAAFEVAKLKVISIRLQENNAVIAFEIVEE